ncbi:MAG: TolC family outer membrane protein, partial [Nitrosomonadales bacterium]|nr:TolC family outer membrane protein [Nitrosomonadales bacterium]
MKSGYTALMVAILLGCGSITVHADTLKATIEKTLATNPEVLGAVANRKATEKELEGAQGPQYPVVDLHLGSGGERSKTPTIPDLTLNRQEVGVTLRQTLYDGGAISGEIARQTARLQALDSRVFDVSDSVAQRVSDIYLEVLKATELYDLAKANLEAHRNYREKIQDRVKAGVAQRADLQLAEGREALASSALTTREAGLEDARIRFRRLVGEMPKSLVRPSAISRAVPALLELATEIAFSNNASLKVAKDEVIAAREAESASRARLMPVVSLDAGVTRNRNIDGIRGQNSDNSLMLMMNYNLFRGGSDKAKIAELGARLTSAMESENNVRRTIEEEVGRAWVALNAARSSLDYLRNHAQHTAEVKDAYQSQFDVGKRTMIDLMNAENELFQAKSSFISGAYSVEQSEHRLTAAMGGILKIYNIQPNPDPDRAQAEKQAVSEVKQVAPEAKQTVPEARQAEPETKRAAPEAKQAEPEVKQAEKQEAKASGNVDGQESQATAEEKARLEADARVAKLKAKQEAKAEAARL